MHFWQAHINISWCFQEQFGIFGEFYVTTERYATMTGATGEQESGITILTTNRQSDLMAKWISFRLWVPSCTVSLRFGRYKSINSQTTDKYSYRSDMIRSRLSIIHHFNAPRPSRYTNMSEKTCKTLYIDIFRCHFVGKKGCHKMSIACSGLPTYSDPLKLVNARCVVLSPWNCGNLTWKSTISSAGTLGISKLLESPKVLNPILPTWCWLNHGIWIDFPWKVGNFIIPTDEVHHFSEG